MDLRFTGVRRMSMLLEITGSFMILRTMLPSSRMLDDGEIRLP